MIANYEIEILIHLHFYSFFNEWRYRMNGGNGAHLGLWQRDPPVLPGPRVHRMSSSNIFIDGHHLSEARL